MYSENLKKIRRFLRDPNGNIWEDGFLLNLWNYKQGTFTRRHGLNETVTVLRTPPMFQMSYMQEWEWSNSESSTGKVYQALIYSRQSQWVCAYFWEQQELGPATGSESDTGYRYTHPWEAYIVGTPADLSPMWFPSDYHSCIYMAYDNEPIEYVSWKNLTSQDRGYRSYPGEPANWTTKEDFEQFFYVYPRPTAVWDDVAGDANAGSVHHSDFATEAAEVGVPIDATGTETTTSYGVATDYLRSDDNILLVYRSYSQDILSNTDEPAPPRYLQKYIEFDVLADAYTANTDGKIKSLGEYWQWRKRVADDLLMRFKYKRLADRNFRLTGGHAPPRQRRGPRLPSTYPPV